MRTALALAVIAASGGLAWWLVRSPRQQGGAIDNPDAPDLGSAISGVVGAFQDGADALQGAVMPDTQLTMSADGLARLQQREGFSATPYPDAGGYSIGYGHFIKPGESFTSITQEEGAQLLASDIAWAERAVRTAVSVPLTQTQFDALVSFAYNVGEGAFRSSTLVKKLNAGDYAGAAAEFPRWNRSMGQVNASLIARRADERSQFEEA